MNNSNTKHRQKSLLASLDCIFEVGGEMIADNGEDGFAYCVNDNYGLISVFDGCGGIGSRKYEVYNNKTGAYIASHISSEVLFDWFDKFSKEDRVLSGNTLKEICDELKKEITDRLKAIEGKTGGSIIKGSLTKSFPTTASIIFFYKAKSALQAAFVWAGDSRGFVLSNTGLHQITKDDIEDDGDAMSNLSNDSKLTNVISANGDYVLNGELISCKEPAILITATDGCFGYFATPMEFEYMLLETLQKSNSIRQWKDNIDRYIKLYTADDYTMTVAVYGYKSFKILKKDFAERKKNVYKNYISRLGGISDSEKTKLWNLYKNNYYRGV